MGRVAPPTHGDLLRIARDPEFAREAMERWGIEALMDPECEKCDQQPPTLRPASPTTARKPCGGCGGSGVQSGSARRR